MPMLASIPSWTADGLLPPMDASDPTSANRAPYAVSLLDFVLRFSTSPQRMDILDGFLRYRAALHAVRLTAGFQWVNGSFAESVETCPRRSRPPNDVDVVTFYHVPLGATQAALAAADPDLFQHSVVKSRFLVDGYPISLSSGGTRLVSQSAYWYSVWAHQRDTLKWKGFLQLDLSPAEDAEAAEILRASRNGGAS